MNPGQPFKQPWCVDCTLPSLDRPLLEADGPPSLASTQENQVASQGHEHGQKGAPPTDEQSEVMHAYQNGVPQLKVFLP